MKVTLTRKDLRSSFSDLLREEREMNARHKREKKALYAKMNPLCRTEMRLAEKEEKPNSPQKPVVKVSKPVGEIIDSRGKSHPISSATKKIILDYVEKITDGARGVDDAATDLLISAFPQSLSLFIPDALHSSAYGKWTVRLNGRKNEITFTLFESDLCWTVRAVSVAA